MLPNNHVTRKISAPLLFISFNLFFYKNNSKNKRKKEEWQKLPDFIRNFLFQTFLKITFSAKNKVQKKRIGRFAPETFITGMSYNKGRYPPSAKQKCCGSPPKNTDDSSTLGLSTAKRKKNFTRKPLLSLLSGFPSEKRCSEEKSLLEEIHEKKQENAEPEQPPFPKRFVSEHI
ncbi:MAG: hypothetical protein ACI4PW_06290, partial [Alphaproteobacteria bacterium]